MFKIPVTNVMHNLMFHIHVIMQTCHSINSVSSNAANTLLSASLDEYKYAPVWVWS